MIEQKLQLPMQEGMAEAVLFSPETSRPLPGCYTCRILGVSVRRT
jgi:hypothetical protein